MHRSIPSSDDSPVASDKARTTFAAGEWFAVALVVSLAAAVYFPTTGFDFVNFDDDVHVFANRHVRTGVTPANLKWAFGIHGPSQWHPLAWMSHQLDSQMFAAERGAASAGGHHLVSVLIHLVNIALLYLVIRRLTGRMEPALLTAALFAVHPLNVESVAWVSERRNVLSLLFFLWALLEYLNYVQSQSRRSYLLVCGLHALALMAKPMVVTFPCILLLLDVWPLQRFSAVTMSGSAVAAPRGWSRRIVLEKIPLLALSAASCVLTILCQQSIGVISSLSALPMSVRIANALVAYTSYLRDTFLPVNLCVYYPHPGLMDDAPFNLLLAPGVISAIVLLVFSLVVWCRRQRSPWLLLGWLWFLGALVPMIGIVQVGEQQRADRYTYLPNIGLYLAMAASLPWNRLTRRPRQWLLRASLAVVLSLAALAVLQVGVWRSSMTLFEHALAVSERNHWAHLNLGQALLEQGDRNTAEQHFLAALTVQPKYGLAHYNLGVICHDRGQREQAAWHFQQAIQLDPGNSSAWVRQGVLLAQSGQLDLAEGHFLRATQVDAEDVDARFNLGLILEARSDLSGARTAYQAALQIAPAFHAARDQLERLGVSRHE